MKKVQPISKPNETKQSAVGAKLEAAIDKRAYQLYQRHGYIDPDDWRQAEAEIQGTTRKAA